MFHSSKFRAGMRWFSWLPWLLWRLAVTVVRLVSFGALDLSAVKFDGGALARTWALMWPFLTSREPWEIRFPGALSLPWMSLSLRSVSAELGGSRSKAWLPGILTLAALGWWAAAQLGDAFWLAYAAATATPLNVVLSAVAVLLAVDALNSVYSWAASTYLAGPRLELRWAPYRLALPRALAGRLLFSLPEMFKVWLIVALVGCGLWLVNHMAVELSYLNRSFMNSFTERNHDKFLTVLQSFLPIMGILIVLGPCYSWVKELLILEWSKFSTRFMLSRYMGVGQGYYPIALTGSPDNPNERIQQDVPRACRLILSFIFVLVDSLVTLYLFSGILWDIEKGLEFKVELFGQSLVIQHLVLLSLIVYSIVGSNGAVRVGKKLIGLNAEQKKLAANFRVGMVLFEKYAEPIAAYRGETREKEQLWKRFVIALTNNYAIVRWQRNLGFFTTGYSKVAQFLPFITLAPFYFAGKVEFGAVSQSAGACAEILYALSIVVSQFDNMSETLATITRVGELKEALDKYEKDRLAVRERVRREEGELLEVSNLKLYTPDGERIIVDGFNLKMEPGKSVLFRGESGSGKTSLLRAIVGFPLWDRGHGVVKMSSRPGRWLMLSQLAYMIDGSLREQLLYPSATAANIADEKLVAILQEVNLGTVLERVGGLEGRPNWDTLSGGERQRLVVARALVNEAALVLADEATSALDIRNEELLYTAMKNHGITMLSVGHRPSLVPFHDVVVELLNDGKGGWRIMPAAESAW